MIMWTNIEKQQMNNTNPLKTEGNLGSFNKAAVPALYMTPIVLHMPVNLVNKVKDITISV
jgi:hypothetical protein